MMNARSRGAVAALLSGVLAGCGVEPAPEPMRPEDTVFETQVEALNEAKEVEGMLLDQHKARDEELQKMGG